MVLEAFIAIGLAGNVIQYVDFCAKLLTGSYEIYSSASGSTKENGHILKIIEDFDDFLRQFKLHSSGEVVSLYDSVHEAALVKFAQHCQQDAGALRNEVASLTWKNEDRHKVWKSFRHALRSRWKESDIKAMEKRLNDYRSEIAVRLMGLLRYASRLV